MSCEKYLKIAQEVREELIKKYGTVRGKCQLAIQLLYKKGLRGVPLSIYFKHPSRREWSSHLVFVTVDLCVIDPTAGQYGYAPLVYPLEDIKKYYNPIAFDIPPKSFFIGKPYTIAEDRLRDYLYMKLQEMGTYPKEKYQELWERRYIK